MKSFKNLQLLIVIILAYSTLILCTRFLQSNHIGSDKRSAERVSGENKTCNATYCSDGSIPSGSNSTSNSTSSNSSNGGSSNSNSSSSGGNSNSNSNNNTNGSSAGNDTKKSMFDYLWNQVDNVFNINYECDGNQLFNRFTGKCEEIRASYTDIKSANVAVSSEYGGTNMPGFSKPSMIDQLNSTFSKWYDSNNKTR